MTRQSAIYEGEVVHTRTRPKYHRLKYKVFTMLLDLDELDNLDRELALFAYNRFAPLSFYDKDHGATRNQPLRSWVEAELRNAGVVFDGGPIRLLCYPRIFGYVFNPISTYFCYARDGQLTAILYEVCNTFNERHTYIIPVDAAAEGMVRQTCEKKLYVSPFNELNGSYTFRIAPPDANTTLIVHQSDAEGYLLSASFKGTRTEITDATLAKMLIRFPLMTLKVVAGIHWEALRLWAKGLKIFRHHPAQQTIASSIGTPHTTRD